MLLVLTIFFFQHGLRDYMQMRGDWNFFTNFLHVWNAPQYEKYSLAVSCVLGVLCLIFYLRTFYPHPKNRSTKRVL